MKTVTVKIIYSPYPPTTKDVVWGHRVDGKVEFKIFGDEGWTVVAKEDILSDIENAIESSEEYTDNVIQEVITNKLGTVNGIATLDGAGKVPSSQLPSYVDDVVEGYYYDGQFYVDISYTQLITGETGKIYVSKDSGLCYRWVSNETGYIEISNREQEQANWSQSNPSRSDYIKDRTHYDDNIVLATIADDFDTSQTFNSDIEVEIGQNIRVRNDTVDITAKITYSGPGAINNYSAYLIDENEHSIGTIQFEYKKLVSVYGVSSLAGATIEYLELKQLDEKFIPDTIARDGDVVHIDGEETVTGVKNFSNGLQVSGQLLWYDTTNQCMRITFN